MKRTLWFFFVLCWVLPAGVAHCEERQTTRGDVEGFTLEIPDAEGHRQAILEGDRATFHPSGIVHILQVTARIFQKDKGEMVVTTDQADYNRDTKVVTTQEPVNMVSKDALIDGRGLIWQPDKQQIFIQKDVQVVMHNVQPPADQTPRHTPETPAGEKGAQ